MVTRVMHSNVGREARRQAVRNDEASNGDAGGVHLGKTASASRALGQTACSGAPARAGIFNHGRKARERTTGALYSVPTKVDVEECTGGSIDPSTSLNEGWSRDALSTDAG